MTINLKITTPERIIFEGEVSQIVLPTKEGEITVLANHAPLISLLEAGEIEFKKDKNDEESILAISSGFLQIQSNSKVVILADSADWLSEIDEDKALEAQKRAKKILEDENLGEVEYAAARTGLQRALGQLKVIRKRRRTRLSKPLNTPV
jgi:F-type H+-transporting ATPase subunit epsilon